MNWLVWLVYTVLMESYNIYEAKTKLSQLIEKARVGVEITIAKAGKPQVKLVPIGDKPRKKIVVDGMKGEIRIKEGFDKTPPEFDPYL